MPTDGRPNSWRLDSRLDVYCPIVVERHISAAGDGVARALSGRLIDDCGGQFMSSKRRNM